MIIYHSSPRNSELSDGERGELGKRLFRTTNKREALQALSLRIFHSNDVWPATSHFFEKGVDLLLSAPSYSLADGGACQTCGTCCPSVTARARPYKWTGSSSFRTLKGGGRTSFGFDPELPRLVVIPSALSINFIPA